MQKVNVRHEHLPRIGERFVLDAESGATLTVIGHRSGRQDITITDSLNRDATTASLTASEASALAMLLTGTHLQLITTDPT